ncbi:response regulator transcription factor [Robertkochia marina]|uniref:Response regulator transcription factor n=1 Tax=Robertkochia marina TaxID=1227945 RepID=A0A4S3M1L5_9FLAO|nr:LytTR family DNA-binding domain-containing protein [Robertkochia marina]THD68972.1 response regulator transcription factor [Robertkochia marina]TRZ44792.1 DNA-binding response regulator [Robertkochia marina]
MHLTCVIIDDEPLAINVIRQYISEMDSLEVSATFNSAIKAADYLRDHEVDLVFLDINMPMLDGLSFLKNFDFSPKVILITAYDQYALEGYELEVVDYLLKPVAFPRFVKAVEKARTRIGNELPLASQQSSANRPFKFIKIDKKKLQKIYLDEIIVVESLKDYIRIITEKGRYIVHQTLSNFTDELPSDQFIRIHRSVTVSLDKIDVVEGNSLEICGKRYTIGRSYLTEAKNIIFQTENSEEGA